MFDAQRTPIGRSTSILSLIASTLLITSAIPAAAQPNRPYPPSSVITDIEWAPIDSIVYKGHGSDNWPLAWADDGDLYTTYGDGWGFEPNVPEKLSLGFARVTGGPSDFTGHNIRSPDEQKGGGRSGRKASGLLCVNGTLYAWVRNANHEGRQSILAWSDNHAQNWTWADWQWKEFGHPAFLNFGKNYSNGPEHLQRYVYLYSPDTPDAYIETDEVILGRVPVDQIRVKGAYEFYAGSDDSGDPIWAAEKAGREPVFVFPGGCNRMDVTYSAALDRYLMTMRSRAKGDGINHFSIYDAPNPWGPWTTVYYAEEWEADGKMVPLSESNKHWGEVAHIPAKWIGEDGRELYLVFAGNDSFAVRKATLIVE